MFSFIKALWRLPATIRRMNSLEQYIGVAYVPSDENVDWGEHIEDHRLGGLNNKVAKIEEACNKGRIEKIDYDAR